MWFTGLSGSGKSSIANEVERQLHAAGTRTYVLDGDNVRSGLQGPWIQSEDRAENVRRISEVARLMVDAGLIVMVCLISPFADDRRKARELFAPGDLIEVFVDTPLDVCVDRDPKGLYAMSASGELANMTGIDQGTNAPRIPTSGSMDVSRSRSRRPRSSQPFMAPGRTSAYDSERPR